MSKKINKSYEAARETDLWVEVSTEEYNNSEASVPLKQQRIHVLRSIAASLIAMNFRSLEIYLSKIGKEDE